MKQIIKFILIKISRVIYWITPKEFRPRQEKGLQKKIYEEVINDTVNHFKEHIQKSQIFINREKIREYAVKTALLNDKNKEYYYLEFGVFKGITTNFFSKYLSKLYCFDSFEGLKEDWAGTSEFIGNMSLDKKIPKLNTNVEPIVGWVEDTLDDFLKKHSPKINFVHLDMDTYSPTKFTLEKIKPYLVKNSIIIFDELYNNPGWREGEFKALKEVFNENEFKYKAFNITSEQCVIQII